MPTRLYPLKAAGGYGQWVVIDSDDEQGGGCVEYGHMWNAFATGLRVGSRVAAGQLIGYVGSNGGSTGPHLHITVWPGAYGAGGRIDPARWLATAQHIADQPAGPPEWVPTMRDFEAFQQLARFL